MSFRRRMVLLAAGAVAAAIVIASVVVYVVTGNELRGQIDASLRQKLTPGLPQAVQVKTVNLSAAQLAKLKREGMLPPVGLPRIAFGAQAVEKTHSGGQSSAHGGENFTQESGGKPLHGEAVSIEGNAAFAPGGPPAIAQQRDVPVHVSPFNKLVLPAPTLGGATGYVQLFRSNGQVLRSETTGSGGEGGLPITPATRAVAAGRREAFFSDATVGGTHVRILTERAPEGGVWQVALPLSDVDSTLTHLKLVLALVCLGGIALAAALGLLVSRAALVPVRRLTGAAERVARTQDLGHRIEAGEEDELGRLAGSFNTMLAALERSRLAQRQLVSDASHELRTPLTSVQANLDALAIGEELPARERARILAAAQAQLRELTVLVGDLVDLSKTEVRRSRWRTCAWIWPPPGRSSAPACTGWVDTHLRSCSTRSPVWCAPRPRAWSGRSPTCSTTPVNGTRPSALGRLRVEVRVRGGVLEVRDHGPGIAAEDLPRVFDRFYRAPSARARPGSGLGLAIVRQTAEAHGGAVHAANDPDGGARLTLELPALEMTDAELAACQRDAPTSSGVV